MFQELRRNPLQSQFGVPGYRACQGTARTQQDDLPGKAAFHPLSGRTIVPDCLSKNTVLTGCVGKALEVHEALKGDGLLLPASAGGRHARPIED